MLDNYMYNCPNPSGISRRILLKRIACFVSGIVVFPQLVNASSEPGNDKSTLTRLELETFESFLEVVIPSSKKYSKFLALEIRDVFYGFSKYFKFLIKCLDEQAETKFLLKFSQISDHEKAQIIHDGTQTGLLKKQVFNGAIYLLQLIVFSGLCERNQSCDIIDFPGASGAEFLTYGESGLNNLHAITFDGNPN